MHMIYELEMTDTFGGEANYSWVKRLRFAMPDDASRRSLVIRAKKLLGMTGRHETDDFGDEIVIRPRGMAVVVTVRVAHTHTSEGNAHD
jgi:hypothetical protein